MICLCLLGSFISSSADVYWTETLLTAVVAASVAKATVNFMAIAVIKQPSVDDDRQVSYVNIFISLISLGPPKVKWMNSTCRVGLDQWFPNIVFARDSLQKK